LPIDARLAGNVASDRAVRDHASRDSARRRAMADIDGSVRADASVNTRRLCHAIHRSDALRRLAVRQLLEHNVQAVCPAFGIDLTAVARHAHAAENRHARQRRLLGGIRLALAGVLSTDVAVTALTFRGHARELVFPAAILCVAFALVAAAWATLFWRVRAERLSALEAWLTPSPRFQFPPVDPALEEMLDGLPHANVIVYADGQGDPFVGSGGRLDRSNIGPIYIRGERLGDGDERKSPEHFTATSLHRYLQEFTPQRGFTVMRACNRLYVRGDYADQVKGLLPDRCASPRLTVGTSVLRHYTERPTPYARTYVCLEQMTPDAHLVVSMYVRARIEDGLLSIESNIFALPPVSRAFDATNEFVIEGRPGATREAVKNATRAVFPALFGQPTQITRRDLFQRRPISGKETLRNIRKGYTHDYGAATSLREAVSFGKRQHNDTEDIIDCARRLRRRLVDTLENFLAEHGVDTSEFRDQANVINNTTISYDIGSVAGQNNIVGSHGQVNNYGTRDGAGK
jgi:hypothetical protein